MPSTPSPSSPQPDSGEGSTPHVRSVSDGTRDDQTQPVPSTSRLLPSATVSPPTLHEEEGQSESTLTPDLFLPLLNCPLCDPPSPLSSPVTLRCGHTVCMSHLTEPADAESSFVSSLLTSIASSSRRKLPLPPCPIPTCRSLRSMSANATAEQLPRHPQSRVNYLPPPSMGPPPLFDNHPDEEPPPLRVDVTVNKIQNLVMLSRPWFDGDLPPRPLPHDDDDEHTDSEPEFDGSDGGAEEVQEPSDPDRRFFASVPGSSLPITGSRRPRSDSPSPPPRPRKRPRRARRQRDDVPNNNAPSLSASARFEKELLAELTCHICFALMWQPVTTPCQHTFCSKCLHRSLDHSTACPLCRQQLPGYDYFQETIGSSSSSTETGAFNKLVLSITLKAFPEAYASRGAAIEEEERQGNLDTPIFICTLCYPGMPMFLNFYEPRYRLMLRRCLATPYPCFGAIPPPRTPPPTSNTPTSSKPEFGTMLEIRNVQLLTDGQCRVETWGTWRFRILDRGSMDGYDVARIERVDDIQDDDLDLPPPLPPIISQANSTTTEDDGEKISHDHDNKGDIFRDAPGPSSSSSVPQTSLVPTQQKTNQELMDTCRAFLDQMREGAAPWVVQQLDNAYIPMPDDPAQFSFWISLLLPIDEHEKAKLLPIRSPRLRLRLVVHWIEQLNSQW
ncbi:hypothetical protein BXZ70DRAFT_991629 [Cristinia sonorae]|uniref:RING-type domain-containing protein n=1 Tax=Cristinia sonorae TaxID=1940300 RepID=A0A8K0ULS9_9AGAR|nr:hypothetical protein BXZ70DRAFT_991629 [Cristinia sonorae]